jgi:hypothetical protein
MNFKLFHSEYRKLLIEELKKGRYWIDNKASFLEERRMRKIE